jgi:hypothetical protein
MQRRPVGFPPVAEPMPWILGEMDARTVNLILKMLNEELEKYSLDDAVKNHPVRLQIIEVTPNPCRISEDGKRACMKPAKQLPFRYRDEVPMCEEHMNQWGQGMFAIPNGGEGLGTYRLSWEPVVVVRGD